MLVLSLMTAARNSLSRQGGCKYYFFFVPAFAIASAGLPGVDRQALLSAICKSAPCLVKEGGKVGWFARGNAPEKRHDKNRR